LQSYPRSAHASIYGYLYQTYLGILRWLDLETDGSRWDAFIDAVTWDFNAPELPTVLRNLDNLSPLLENPGRPQRDFTMLQTGRRSGRPPIGSQRPAPAGRPTGRDRAAAGRCRRRPLQPPAPSRVSISKRISAAIV
jgi:hypothetical protein